MELGSSFVRELIRKEVPDWDDEVVARARFKAFSGQRPDWEPIYLFWRDLIFTIARHLGLVILRPSQIKDWFNRGGLTPLCLDHVLLVMYNEGDLVRSADLVDPTTGRPSQIFRKVRNLMVRPMTTCQILDEHLVILMPVLKDKAVELVKLLSETHWTSSCIITMGRFQHICGGVDEASAVLSYLSGQGKAQYILVKKGEIIQGVKVCLSASAAYSISSLDCDVLYLIWTMEKLQQQFNVIDQRCERLRKSAVTSLNSGNKNVALRHARALKLATESREKCATLLNRVEEVLNVIANAESTKKVSEAIRIGAQAIKENRIGVEEVQHCLEELEESVDLQKQVEIALESTPPYTFADDEDIEEEFKKLGLEIESANRLHPIPKTEAISAVGETEALESTEQLTDALSNLKIVDNPVRTAAGKENLEVQTA
ncbi:hypothetical protein FNV43_RR23712 [Rhamnella rubrinervis]|uniref:Charged multivesicular body protein 7 n=1 Tax=Rhamnella rubrinervis TaxID=2594499 RepID=A0A8K0DZG4_9ROSA|nr:hypothetical protein FNV43_RR23712 [Rhamnella rubrinervis]